MPTPAPRPLDAPTAAVATLAVLPAFAVGLPPLAAMLGVATGVDPPGLPWAPLRWLLLAAAVVAAGLLLRHRDLPRLLVVVTLVLAATLPEVPRRDAGPGGVARVTVLPWAADTVAADADAIRSLRARADGRAGRLPGAPPPPDALEARLAPTGAALRALQAADAAWRLQRDALARKVDERRALIAELQADGARGSLLNRALVAGRIAELQATILLAQEAARPGLEQARERLDLALGDAMARTVALRADIAQHQRWAARHDAMLRGAPYLLAACATLLWLAWCTSLRSLAFAAGLVGAAALALAAAWGADEGRGVRAAIALAALPGAALATLLVRAAWRAIQDNRELRADFTRRQWIRALLRAAWVWSPAALLLIGVHLVAGPRLLDAAVSRAACVGDDASCRGALLRNADPARDTVRGDLHAAIDRAVATVEARIDAAIDDAVPRASTAAPVDRAATLRALERALPAHLGDVDPRLRPPACGWTDGGCMAGALLLRALDRAWVAAREPLRVELAARVPAMAAPGAAANARTDPARSALAGVFDAVASDAHADLDALLAGTALVFALKATILLLLALRSFLHVLARTLFAQDRDAYATMTPGERAADAGVEVTITDGSRLPLDLSGSVLYVRRAVDVDDAVPETALLPPQPLRAPLARLRAGCWQLKRIDGGSSVHAARRIALVGAQGAQFVLWRIPPGASVAFRWDRFVAMSGGVTLRRSLCAKLTRVASGRVTTDVAHGPGLLVLRSYGAPDTTTVSVAPERLLGWCTGTRFRVEASPAFASVWIDPCQVRADEPGRAVIDAPRDGAGGRGALRDARRAFGG